jgi:hypothetical protein
MLHYVLLPSSALQSYSNAVPLALYNSNDWTLEKPRKREKQLEKLVLGRSSRGY